MNMASFTVGPFQNEAFWGKLHTFNFFYTICLRGLRTSHQTTLVSTAQKQTVVGSPSNGSNDPHIFVFTLM